MHFIDYFSFFDEVHFENEKSYYFSIKIKSMDPKSVNQSNNAIALVSISLMFVGLAINSYYLFF